MQLVKPTLNFEKSLLAAGIKSIAGIDEVGRGAFAGPVVAACVVLPTHFRQPKDLADSKLLKPRQREKLSIYIKKNAICYSIAEVDVNIINRVGIGKATQIAFRKSIKTLSPVAEYFLIDAFYVDRFPKTKQTPIKKGDQICTSIAAASIIAKVHRDFLMKKLHYRFPQYGFAKHKGYGTKFHQAQIKKFGLTRFHRKAFIHFI